jgi:ATP-binding cassette, subfamily C, bacterial
MTAREHDSMMGVRLLLRDLLSGHRPQLMRAGLAGGAVAVLEGANSWALLALLSLLLGGQVAGALAPLAGTLPPFSFYQALLAYLLVSVALIACQLAYTHLGGLLARAYGRSLRAGLLEHLAAARWLAVRGIPAPDLAHALSTGSQQAGLAARNGLAVAVQAGTVAAQFGVLALVKPTLLAPGLALLGLFALASRLGRKRLAGMLAQLRTQFLALHQGATDYAQGIKFYKANRLQARFGQRIRETGEAADTLHADWMTSGALRRAAAMLFGTIAIASAAYLAHASSLLPTGTLIAIAVIVFRLFPALTGLQQSLHGLSQTADAVANIKQLEQRLVQRENAQIVNTPPPQPSPIQGEGVESVVALDHVSVRYPGREPVAGPFDLSLGRGEWLIVRGLSGSGKTTLLDLLAGLLAQGAAPGVFSGRVAYATQDPYFFHGTLRENFSFAPSPSGRGDGVRAEDAIWHALTLCLIADIVRGLPDGLDTRIDSRLSLLSGGQRQRIALARALLQAPELLLLDEATNAVDAPTESRILHGIRAANPAMAVILATHRVEALEFAHRVIELDTTHAGT